MSRYIELYRFLRQGGLSWRYTASESAVEWDNFTWQPLPIERSGIELGPEIERSRVEISVPADSDLGQLARQGIVEERLDATIFRQVGSLTAVIWQGAIVDVSWAPLTATLIGQPQSATVRQLGLRQRYGRACRWRLYSSGCGIGSGDFAVGGQVSEALGTSLTIPDAGSYPDGWFTGGYLDHSSGRRYIRSHVQSTIEIVSVLPQLAAGDAVTLYAGCDHTLGTCQTKFDNAENFGGFPWIPTTDPHGRRLR